MTDDQNAALIALPAPTIPTLEIAAEIVCAFVACNPTPASALPQLIRDTHAAVVALTVPPPAPEAAPLVPAVPVKKSVTDDYIISLEDGRKLKSMKRYLAGLGMTPDQYRAKWDLPHDYPMVAPSYSAHRTALAKATGLGTRSPATQAAPAQAA